MNLGFPINDIISILRLNYTRSFKISHYILNWLAVVVKRLMALFFGFRTAIPIYSISPVVILNGNSNTLIKEKYFQYFLGNCPKVNAMIFFWCFVNKVSGNGLVLSETTHCPSQYLPGFMSPCGLLDHDESNEVLHSVFDLNTHRAFNTIYIQPGLRSNDALWRIIWYGNCIVIDG